MAWRHRSRLLHSAFHFFRNSWRKWAVLCVAIVVLLQLTYLIHDNRLAIFKRVCGLDHYNHHDIAIPVGNKTGSSEFPIVYELASCDPSKNTSVPNAVCRHFSRNMRQSERQTMLRIPQYFDQMATKHNWTYFIVFGTLWGSWRHHDVIPWDHDIDIMVEHKDRMDIVEKIEALQERYVPKQCTHSKIHLYDREHVTSTTYFENVGRWNNPSVDMFFFVRNSTHIRRADYAEDYVQKIEEIFPLHRRPLSTLMVPSPRDTLSHLVANYGPTDICGLFDSPLEVYLHHSPKCEEYKQYLPFVHRKWKNDKMEESLIFNGKVVEVKYINEMRENIPFSPYTLASQRRLITN